MLMLTVFHIYVFQNTRKEKLRISHSHVYQVETNIRRSKVEANKYHLRKSKIFEIRNTIFYRRH